MPPSDKTATPPLPATAAEVTDRQEFTRVVTSLASAIVKAVSEGKSVTAGNKRLITCAAEEIRRAVHALAIVSPPAPPAPASPDAPAAPAAPPAPLAPLAPTTNDDLRKDIMACVRAEFQKLKAELSPPHRTADPSPARPTYAQATRKRDSQAKRAPAPVKKPPPPTRPAIIIETRTTTNDRQQAVEAFRRSISFRTSDYAPARVQPISHNKLRVEFETTQQCDDALLRLTDASEVTAERARLRQPMLLLKGISKNTPREDLVGVIRVQNNCAAGDLAIKLVRNNKNSALYNAVLVASPEVWRKLIGLGRVSVDHQRVHAERFSPFLQCFACLQFGHVRKDCRPDAAKPCALCASTAHQEPDCPAKDELGSLKCYNCSNLNAKFKGTAKTNHKATSGSCPVVRGMRTRVESRVDYGTA